MANSLSSKKRVRQNVSRQARNKSRKSELKSLVRKFDNALKVGDTGKAEQELRAVTKRLDQVASSSAMHKNTAARKKSRLAKRLNALKTPAAG